MARAIFLLLILANIVIWLAMNGAFQLTSGQTSSFAYLDPDAEPTRLHQLISPEKIKLSAVAPQAIPNDEQDSATNVLDECRRISGFAGNDLERIKELLRQGGFITELGEEVDKVEFHIVTERYNNKQQAKNALQKITTLLQSLGESAATIAGTQKSAIDSARSQTAKLIEGPKDKYHILIAQAASKAIAQKLQKDLQQKGLPQLAVEEHHVKVITSVYVRAAPALLNNELLALLIPEADITIAKCL